MIRVDHAGEYGAVRIYEGQLAVFGASEIEDRRRDPAHGRAGTGTSEGLRCADQRAPRTPDGARTGVAGRRIRAGRGDRADGRKGGNGVYRCGGRGDRRALCRPDRKAGRQRSGAEKDGREAFRADEIAHRDTAFATARGRRRLSPAWRRHQGGMPVGDSTFDARYERRQKAVLEGRRRRAGPPWTTPDSPVAAIRRGSLSTIRYSIGLRGADPSAPHALERFFFRFLGRVPSRSAKSG